MRPDLAPAIDGQLNANFVEWLLGLPIGHTDVGISRANRLRACGNGIVPQQMAAALVGMLERIAKRNP